MNITLSRFLNVRYGLLSLNRLNIFFKSLPSVAKYNSRTKIIPWSSIFGKSNIEANRYLSKNYSVTSNLNQVEFLELCEETLSNITDHFEELVESEAVFKSGDISYSDGVLTAFLGPDFGTYVINRQTPNQQIWLSSPTTGPKRYNYLDGQWIYSHDKSSLHSLLDREIGAIAKNTKVNFSSLPFNLKK